MADVPFRAAIVRWPLATACVRRSPSGLEVAPLHEMNAFRDIATVPLRDDHPGASRLPVRSHRLVRGLPRARWARGCRRVRPRPFPRTASLVPSELRGQLRALPFPDT